MRRAKRGILKKTRVPRRSSETMTLGDPALEVGDDASRERSRHSSAVDISDAVSRPLEVTSRWRGGRDARSEGRPIPRPSALLLDFRLLRPAEWVQEPADAEAGSGRATVSIAASGAGDGEGEEATGRAGETGLRGSRSPPSRSEATNDSRNCDWRRSRGAPAVRGGSRASSGGGGFRTADIAGRAKILHTLRRSERTPNGSISEAELQADSTLTMDATVKSCKSDSSQVH